MNSVDWKLKLLSLLHDPPSKSLDIVHHEEKAKGAMARAGFSEDEVKGYNKPADHTASAADRIPFPFYKTSGVKCKFDGVNNAFLHPLGDGDGNALKIPFQQELTDVSAFDMEDTEQSIQPVLNVLPEEWGEDEKWRARFFAHWRLWPKFATEKDYRFGFLPADTRIPDHSIWNHMQLVSAMAGCEAEGSTDALAPAFLKLQIGPVQDLIAQARSTRDLWSGSYLLSWLMAAGLKKLSELSGPDSAIYPSLREQPLFDLHWKQDLWSQVKIGDQPVWESFDYEKTNANSLMTPNLPHVFLALVPARQAGEIAEKVRSAIIDELHEIAEYCWDYCEEAKIIPDKNKFGGVIPEDRFYDQVDKTLTVSWQVTPWPKNNDEVLERVKAVPFSKSDQPGDTKGDTPRHRVEMLLKMAQEQMPEEHRDARYYTDKSKTKLNNVGISWALLVALNAWQFDGVRKTRAFDGWTSGGWEVGTIQNKDSITGEQEAVLGGSGMVEKCKSLEPKFTTLGKRFKHDDWLSAISLIKRVWDLAYLEPVYQLTPPKMPNTHGMARHEPFSNDDEDKEEDLTGEKYFAILALDGDQIGKWVYGEKSPRFKTQLADYTQGEARLGAVHYFENNCFEDKHGQNLLETRRPVSSGYHLQFSEALTNFALKCARPVVEAFDGRLIYSGGDDVLAMLPADSALPCAQALRMAFRGDPALKTFLNTQAKQLPTSATPNYAKTMANTECLLGAHQTGSGPVHGFMCRLDKQQQHSDGSSKPIPFLVPGPATDCSVGLAVAHFKTPLQDVVREAQAAEKRAKKKLGRAAIALTLLKRSGETIEWGCNWKDGGLELYQQLAEALANGRLTNRFPYRVSQLLEPYTIDTTPLAKENEENGSITELDDFEPKEIMQREIAHALGQHCDSRELQHELMKRFDDFLCATSEAFENQIEKNNSLAKRISKTTWLLNALNGLCKSVAFIERGKSISNNKTDQNQHAA